MKKFIIILSILFINSAYALRYEVETIGGVTLKVENSYEELEAAGKNPKFLMLTLDAPSLSYTTADYSSGTDYTPPVGRVFHVKGVQLKVTTAADLEFILCTSTAALAGAGGCTNYVYWMSSNGSGYPRTLKCDNVATCTHNISNLTLSNGRYLAFDVTTGGATRNGQVFGYEADE